MSTVRASNDPSRTTARHATPASRITASLRSAGIAWVTCGLFILLSITTEGFLRIANLRNILDQQGLILIAAAFATLVVIAGGFDISQAATAVLSAIVAVRVLNSTGSIPLGVLAGVAIGVLVGVINGVMVAKLYIDSFITTLATSFAWFGIAFWASDRSILRPDYSAWIDLARTRVFGLTTLTWISFAVVGCAWFMLSSTSFGRYIYATGSNPEAARLSGVNTARVTIAVFALSGAAAGLAGVLNSSRSTSAQASDDFGFVFSVVAAIVLGGTSISGGDGAVWRTVFGALFVAFIVNGMNLWEVDPIWQRVVLGVVIVFAVSVDSFVRRRR